MPECGDGKRVCVHLPAVWQAGLRPKGNSYATNLYNWSGIQGKVITSRKLIDAANVLSVKSC
jgi:hypothetical protein